MAKPGGLVKGAQEEEEEEEGRGGDGGEERRAKCVRPNAGY